MRRFACVFVSIFMLAGTVATPAFAGFPAPVAGPSRTTASTIASDPSMPSTMTSDPSIQTTGDMQMGTTTDISRVGRGDRVTSSVEISGSHFATGTVDSAVLVNGYVYSESLAAPALAGAVEGPVLVSRADHVSASVLDELDRLGVSTVYLVGGTTSLSTGVRADLDEAGFAVVRISGANKYATAAAVARKVASIRGSIARAFVVNANDPYDAIAAAPYEYSQGFPVLFTSATGVPAETSRAIRTNHIRTITVLGGTSLVSKAAFLSLSGATTGRGDGRIFGSSRFETARLLATYAVNHGWAEPTMVGLANGTTGFAQALAGATMLGKHGSVVLLVTQTDLPRPSEQFINQYASVGAIDDIHLIGGVGLISDSVVAELNGMGMGATTGSQTGTPTVDPHGH